MGRKKSISAAQYEALNILLQGGKMFYFVDDNTAGLDDKDGNTLKFSLSTFAALRIRKLIEPKETPALGCEIYGLTNSGQEFIVEMNEILKELLNHEQH